MTSIYKYTFFFREGVPWRRCLLGPPGPFTPVAKSNFGTDWSTAVTTKTRIISFGQTCNKKGDHFSRVSPFKRRVWSLYSSAIEINPQVALWFANWKKNKLEETVVWKTVRGKNYFECMYEYTLKICSLGNF